MMKAMQYAKKVSEIYERAADIDRASVFKQPGMVRETVPAALGLMDEMAKYITALEAELAAARQGQTILTGNGGFVWRVKL